VAARCRGAAELVGRVGIADESGVGSLGGGLDSIAAPVGRLALLVVVAAVAGRGGLGRDVGGGRMLVVLVAGGRGAGRGLVVMFLVVATKPVSVLCPAD
jgi:hypothetical protein